MVPGRFSWFPHGSRMVLDGSRLIFIVFMVPGWFFMVTDRFSWFFMVPDWFFMVPCRFSWFFHGSRLVFHGSRSGFHGFSWFQVGFHGFPMVPEWFWMVPG